MNNRPVFTMGMADYYEGPIEDENWLGIQHGRFPVYEISGLATLPRF